MGEKLACWTEGFSTADLDFNNFRASLTSSCPFCIVAGSFFSTAPFKGQKDCREPYMGTSSYQPHVITSSISILVCGFYLHTMKISFTYRYPKIQEKDIKWMIQWNARPDEAMDIKSYRHCHGVLTPGIKTVIHQQASPPVPATPLSQWLKKEFSCLVDVMYFLWLYLKTV